SWFCTYSKLILPHAVAFGNGSNKNLVLFSTISGRKYEIILTNFLLILEFHISLISINCLSTPGLSTIFLARSSIYYVQR
ncbi:hypothetical protein PAXRUDRAFT_108221, partial [Paxillus rubicundulus Ve08.2h10]